MQAVSKLQRAKRSVFKAPPGSWDSLENHELNATQSRRILGVPTCSSEPRCLICSCHISPVKCVASLPMQQIYSIIHSQLVGSNMYWYVTEIITCRHLHSNTSHRCAMYCDNLLVWLKVAIHCLLCAMGSTQQLPPVHLLNMVLLACFHLSCSPRAICVQAQLDSVPLSVCKATCTILCCMGVDTCKQLSVYHACNTESCFMQALDCRYGTVALQRLRCGQ